MRVGGQQGSQVNKGAHDGLGARSELSITPQASKESEFSAQGAREGASIYSLVYS
jgi:hypothetical protein